MPARLLPLGERAVLAEVDSAEEVLALADRLRSLGRPGWEVVPAARTVMVRVPDRAELPAAREAVEQLGVGELAPSGGTDEHGTVETVTVPVTYDGPDLDEVAELTGLSVQEVVAAHTGADYVVAFIGFAPGFAYLVGGDERLHVPRRSAPRTSVPAGAVGLAGEYSGIYPRSSPGGWQLLGRTDAVLFDVHRDPPTLLAPGTRVRFEAT